MRRITSTITAAVAAIAATLTAAPATASTNDLDAAAMHLHRAPFQGEADGGLFNKSLWGPAGFRDHIIHRDTRIAPQGYHLSRSTDPTWGIFATDAHRDTSWAVVTGDWDGNGLDEPAFVRGNSIVLTNALLGGQVTRGYTFGRAGDVPVAGDWDGDGRDTIAMVRGNFWYLPNADGTTVLRSFTFGRSTDQKYAGDWDGDRVDTPAVGRPGDRVFFADRAGATVHSSAAHPQSEQFVSLRVQGKTNDALVAYRFDPSTRGDGIVVRYKTAISDTVRVPTKDEVG